MLYFFDTSALQHRYIDGAKSRGIRKTISDPRNACFISTATILEIASAFGTQCRRHSLSRVDYRRWDQWFWSDVRSGLLKFREPSQREYTRALHLIAYAGIDLRRRISSFDALIAASCLELAIERSARVRFCLADWTLYDIVRNVSAYRSTISFRFVGTAPT